MAARSKPVDEPVKVVTSRFIVGGTLVDVDTDALTNKEGMAVEKAVGVPLQDWSNPPSTAQLTALVWIYRRRAGLDVAYNDVEFTLGDIVDPDVTDPVLDPHPAEKAPA